MNDYDYIWERIAKPLLDKQAREITDKKDAETLSHIKNLMDNTHWTASEAMDAMGISAADQKTYATLLTSNV